jgi:hypothetical protein
MSYDELDDNVKLETQPKGETTALAIRTSIDRIEGAMTEFDRISAGLEDLARRYPPDLVYDVTTTRGMADAIAHRAAWRDPRINVEKFRKTAKAPVLALGKDIDARAAWLTEQLLLGETPVHEQIKAEEARKEEERQARINAEFERVQKIEDAIGEIHMDAMVAAGKPSATILAAIEALRTTPLDPLVFQERMQQAEAARTAGIAKLEVAYKAKLHDEQEAARLAAERAELAELRAAAAAQRERDAAAARIEQERIAAEQAAEAKRLKDAADAISAQRVELDRQRAAVEARERAAAPITQTPEEKGLSTGTPVAYASSAPQAAQGASSGAIETAAHADQRAAASPSLDNGKRLSTGEICRKLGYTVSVEFLRTLGFAPEREGASSKYRECDLKAIGEAIASHTLKVTA